jgi:hypothetical protein
VNAPAFTVCRSKGTTTCWAEKGFVDAEVTHATSPTYGNRRHLTLTFTVDEGTRGRPIRAAEAYSPAERCLR